MPSIEDYEGLMKTDPLGSKTAVARDSKYYESLIDNDPVVQQRSSIEKNLSQSLDRSPDEEAEIQKLSEESGVPRETARQIKPALQKEKQLQDLDIPSLQKRSPITAKKMEDPDFSMVGGDDIRTLENLEWAFRAIPKAFQQGREQLELADIGLRQLSAGQGFIDKPTRDELDRAKEIEERQNVWLGNEGPFQGGLIEATKLLPQRWEMLKAAVQFGGAGGVASAGLALLGGQAGPQVAVPEEIITVPAAFMAGFTPGATAGTAWVGFKLEAGLAYREFDSIRDVSGKPLDENVKRIAAVGVGGINAMLESFALGKTVKYAGGDKIMEVLGRKGLKEILKKPTVQDALMELGKRYAMTNITEVSTELLQESVNIIGEALAKEVSDGDFDQATKEEIGQRLLGVGVKTSQAMLFLGGGGPAVNFGHDIYKIKKAEQNQEVFAAMGQAVEGSKLQQRMPEKIEEFVAEIKKQGDVEDIGIPVEEFVNYFQEVTGQDIKNSNVPEFLNKLGIGKEHIAEAMETKGDILIPLEKFVAHIAPTEHLKGLMQDLRLHAGDMTAREAELVKADIPANLEKEIKNMEAGQAGQVVIDEQSKVIKEQVKKSLMDSGRAPEQAEHESEVTAAIFRTAAINNDSDILELFNSKGFEVKGPEHDAAIKKAARESAVAAQTAFLEAKKNGLPPEEVSKLFTDYETLKSVPEDSSNITEEGGDLELNQEGRGENKTESPDKIKSALKSEVIDGLDEKVNELGVGFQELEVIPVPEADIIETMTPEQEEMLDRIDMGHVAFIDSENNDFVSYDVVIDGNAVGVMTVQRERSTGNIVALHDILIDKKHQKSGYGERAVSSLIASIDEPLFIVEAIDAAKPFWSFMGANGVFDQHSNTLVDWGSYEKNKQAGRTGAYWSQDDSGGASSEQRENENAGGQGGSREDSGQDSYGSFDLSDLEENQGDLFEQPGDDSPRASIKFNSDRTKTLIQLLQNADGSSYIHELGHFGLDLLIDMSKNTSNERIKQDYESVKKWLSNNSAELAAWIKEKRGETVSEDVIKSQIEKGDFSTGVVAEAMHEYWARGWERYMFEGKAPSINLQRAFARFTRWVAQAYKTMIDKKLDVGLNDEVRGVMDRLLATEQEIEEARNFQGAVALWTSAESAGMTQAEFKNYQAKATKAADTDMQRLFEKLVKEITREKKKWWNDEKAEVTKDVEAEVNSRPVFLAHHFLTQKQLLVGEMPEGVEFKRLSGTVLKEIYGPDYYKGMPKFTWQKEGGLHPDMAAELFGFRSGDEMIQALKEKEANKVSRKGVIAKEVDRIMKERHGDILNDGTIKAQAIESLMNDPRGDFIATELKHLEKLTSQAVKLGQRRDRKSLAETRKFQRTADSKTAREAARIMIGRKRERDIQPSGYERSARRLSKDVEKLVAARDFESAVVAKRQQLLNHFLYIEAVRAKDEFKKGRNYARKFDKKQVAKSISPDFLQQINLLLSKYDFRQMSLKKIDEAKSLGEWIQEKWAENIPVDIPAKVQKDSLKTNYRDLTLEDFRDVMDALKNMEHLGRREMEYILNAEKRAFDEVKEEFLAKFATLKDAKPAALNKFASENKLTMSWDIYEQGIAEQTKPSFMASFIDQGKPGIAHDIIVRPFMKAEAEYHKMMTTLGKSIFDVMLDMPREDQKRLNQKVFIKSLDMTFTIADIYSVGLNMGTESNLDKLKRGGRNGVEWSDQDVDEIVSHLTQADWQRIQQIWDGLDKIKPLLFDLAEKIQGAKPPEVAHRAFTNRFGDKLNGGYYPIVYDRNQGKNIKVDAKKSQQEGNMWGGNNFMRPDSQVGAMYERTQYAGPLRFDLENLSNHVTEIIYQVTHYEAVEQYYKMMKDTEVANAFIDKFGKQHYVSMLDLAVDVSNNGHIEGPANWLTRGLRHVRQGTTLFALGYKLTTMAIQPAGLIVSATRGAGPKYTIKGILKTFQDVSKDGGKFAFEHSLILGSRIEQFDREVNNQMKKLQGKTGVATDIQRMAFAHIGYTQLYIVDLPTWYGAYMKEMDSTGNHELAIRQADLSVEQTQGSGAIRDMAKLMRSNNEGVKQLTMFMTFFSAQFGQIRAMTREGKESGNYWKPAAQFTAMITATVAYEALLRGKAPEDDEDWVEWFMAQNAMYAVQSLPGIRDFAGAVLSDFDYQLSPIGTLGQQVKKITNDSDKAKTEAILKSMGIAFHLPIGQPLNSMEHLYDVSQGDRDFTVRELLFGNNYKK